jgi:hypothetical protein
MMLDNEARARGGRELQRTMTTAQRVFRRIASGRFKERALTPAYALAEACAFRDRLESDMQKQGLEPGDCATAIVFVDAEGDAAGVYAIRLKHGEETSVLDKMMQIKTAVTIGLVIAIMDRERDERILKAYPFLKGEQSLKWLSGVLDRQEVREYVN